MADKVKLTEIGDQTVAAALRVAERRLMRLGWSHSDEDIGKTAAAIINAYSAGRAASEPTHDR